MEGYLVTVVAKGYFSNFFAECDSPYDIFRYIQEAGAGVYALLSWEQLDDEELYMWRDFAPDKELMIPYSHQNTDENLIIDDREEEDDN